MIRMLRGLLEGIKSLLRVGIPNIDTLTKLTKYSKDIIDTINYARKVYYDTILPLITTEVSGSVVGELIASQLPRDRPVKIHVFDGRYYVPDKDVLDIVLETSIQKHLKPMNEVFDCDDYAFALKSFSTEVFLINAIGIATGSVTDENGKVGYHAWNIGLISEADGVKLVTIEPQSGNWNYGLVTKVGNLTYRPEMIII